MTKDYLRDGRCKGEEGNVDFFYATYEYLFVVFVHHPGEPLHNNFVDLVRFDSQGKIAQMKEFFDSEHVHRHIDAHEKKQKQEKE